MKTSFTLLIEDDTMIGHLENYIPYDTVMMTRIVVSNESTAEHKLYE